MKCAVDCNESFDVIDEWVRWLGYEPEFEVKRKKELNSRLLEDLTDNELEELARYNTQRRDFDFYSKLDGEKTYFVDSDVLEALMVSKLTPEEIDYANEFVNFYIDDNETLESIISEGKARYNELSMVDAYILHMVMKNLLSFNGKAKVLKGIDNG